MKRCLRELGPESWLFAIKQNLSFLYLLFAENEAFHPGDNGWCICSSFLELFNKDFVQIQKKYKCPDLLILVCKNYTLTPNMKHDQLKLSSTNKKDVC